MIDFFGSIREEKIILNVLFRLLSSLLYPIVFLLKKVGMSRAISILENGKCFLIKSTSW